ncbi:MAG: sulfatase [Planctomycetota bacterium]
MKRLQDLIARAAAPLLACGVAPFTLADAATTPERPNVLLIVCDDLNDAVECFGGHPQAYTPNLDAFAQTGVRFQRAYTNNPVCAPARASFLLGQYNHTSGNLFWGKWRENEVQRNSHTLMSFFRENGYHTAGTGKLMHHFHRPEWTQWGHDQDYGPTAWNGEKRVGHPDVPAPFREIGPIDGSYGPLSGVTFDGADGGGWSVGPWNDIRPWRYDSESDRDPTPDERNAAWAADFIRNYDGRGLDKPFFLGVGFIRPHTPMHAAQRFFDLFPIENVELPPIKWDDTNDTHWIEVFGKDRKGPKYYIEIGKSYPTIEDGLKAYIQAYLACVAAVDHNISVVLDALDNSPHRDNTIVIITSDHGFHLGEKEQLFKGSPWEESTRVPLIVRAPGVTPEGADAGHPVSLVDLYPTLIDLCGLEGDTRKNAKGKPLDGFSMRPFLENPEHGVWDGPPSALTMVYGGWDYRDTTDQHNWTLRSQRYRYIRYRDGGEELYDHDADPHEWHNLANDPAQADTLASFRQELHDRLPEAYRPAPRQ